jgi:hypothetical protein
VNRTNEAIKNIRADRYLSPVGRSTKLTDLLQSGADAIKKEGTDRKPFFDLETKRAQENIPVFPGPQIDARSIALELERRDLLRSMDPISRKMEIESAAARGDHQYINSVLADPMHGNLYSGDIAALKEKTMRAAHPSAWEKLDSIRDSLAHMRANERTGLNCFNC